MDWQALHKSFGWLEWELAAGPLELTVVDPEKKLPPGIQKLRISRDDEYRLVVEFEGRGKHPGELFPDDADDQGRGWRRVEGITIKATRSGHGDPEFVLSNCVVTNTSVNHSLLNNEVVARGRLSVWSISLHEDSQEEPDRVVEWYLNGPRDWFYWPDLTDFDTKDELTVSRFSRGGKGHPLKGTFTQESHSGSVDCMILEGESFRAIAHKVPKEIGPEWATPMGIEYRQEWGIPAKEVRASIAQALSFALGTELLHVGQSDFKADYRVGAVSYNMWVGPTRHICSATQFSPFDWAPGGNKGQTAKPWVVNLVERYLVLNAALDIEAGLRFYWLSSRSPSGYNFPLLASAMEGLVSRWARANGGQKVQYVMEPAEFSTSMASAIDSLVAKPPVGARAAIRQHMMNANRWSGNQQWKLTLEALGIRPTDDELEALAKRHVFAHGIEADELLRSGRGFALERAYRSLFIRIMLAILGHHGFFLNHGPPEPVNCWMDAQTLPAEIKGVNAPTVEGVRPVPPPAR